jgi:hypothetical protein
MERENFYLLLELSLDPPEDREEVIEKAIDSLRARWSRFRNHPTKSLQAKKIIGMIPEVRRVMLDPKLRKEEASRAREKLKKELASKYSEIDRHIAIRMSKGFMTDEEIFKLAKMHQMSEADIRARIRRKQEEKNAEIDKSIAIRMSKGYITEDEIGKIAKLHTVDNDQVRQRIHGPIRKEAAGSIDKLETLDKSIAGVISSNLEIVGKASLYDFLELPPGSELELLQKKAKEKEAQIHKTSATDAAATASGILAGHCLTLFKDETKRRLYDATLAQFHLKDLNSDIDVAGMDGKIRAEYLDVLVERAVQFGMDGQEARAYIENYCRRRNWTIEKTKKRHLSPVLIAVACLVLIGAGFAAYKVIGQQRSEKAYQQLTARVDHETDLNRKEQLLRSFIRANQNSDIAGRARHRLEVVQRQIAEVGYQHMIRQADGLAEEGRLDEAEKICKQYFGGHPGSSHAPEIKKKIAALAALRDEAAFEKLKSTGSGDVYARVAAARSFLETHPESAHRSDAEKTITAAREAYYVRLLRDGREAENAEDLQVALTHLGAFLEIYDDDSRIINLKDLQSTLESRLADQLALATLKVEAQKAGSDTEAARNVYRDYLLSYPDSTVKEEVQAELQRIDRQQEKIRIATLKKSAAVHLERTGDRFRVSEGDGIAQEVKNGLMWALLDASDELGDGAACLDYKAAHVYVKSMKLGGFTDWRLPTPDELQQLYRDSFPLPPGKRRWYWTSRSYTRYADADGWSKVVDVVASAPGGDRKSQLDSRECASVRAVRKP